MVNNRNTSRRTLKEKVYLIVKERILTQKFRLGDSLNEIYLSKELGVSRTPVREAIQQLCKDELVEILPNRGAYVKFISLNDLKDTFQLLKILEGATSRMAADQIAQIKLKKLEEEFLSLQEKEDQATYEEEQKIGIQLHELILETTGNTKIINLLNGIREQIRALSVASIESPGRVKEAIREHLEIISAFKKRDGVAAEYAMVTHLDNVYKNILKFTG